MKIRRAGGRSRPRSWIEVADRTNDLQKINIELRDQQRQLRELSWQVSQTEGAGAPPHRDALHDGLAQVLAVASIRIDAIRKNGGIVPDDDLNDDSFAAR